MKKCLLVLMLAVSFSAFSQNTKPDSLARKPDCPVCKSNQFVIPILYGKPGKVLILQAERGEIRLGGCRVGPQSPKYYCKKDEKEF